MGAVLEYAKQLGKRGSVATSQRLCRAIMAATDDDERRPVMTAALTVLASTQGLAAQAELMKAVDHADPEYPGRSAASRRKGGRPGFRRAVGGQGEEDRSRAPGRILSARRRARRIARRCRTSARH